MARRAKPVSDTADDVRREYVDVMAGVLDNDSDLNVLASVSITRRRRGRLNGFIRNY